MLLLMARPLDARALHRSSAKVSNLLKEAAGALGFRGATCGEIVRIGTRGRRVRPIQASDPASRKRRGTGLGKLSTRSPRGLGPAGSDCQARRSYAAAVNEMSAAEPSLPRAEKPPISVSALPPPVTRWVAPRGVPPIPIVGAIAPSAHGTAVGRSAAIFGHY